MTISLDGVIAVSWTLNAIAIVTSLGRYIIRLRVSGSLYWDDLTHFIAMLCMIGISAIFTGLSGLAKSVASYSSHQSSVVPNWHQYLQGNAASWVVGFSCYWAVKATFLILYRMLFGVSRAFRRAWWVVTIFVFLTYWVVVAGSLVQCGGSASHLTDYEVCNSPSSLELQHNTFIYTSALNIASDVATLALPIGMVYNLQMSRKGRIGLIVLFSLALATIAFEILRLVMSLQGTGSNLNTLWSNLEASVAVIVSSLPTYNFLLHRTRKSSLKRQDSWKRLAASKNSGTPPETANSSDKDMSSVRHYDEEMPVPFLPRNI